MYNNFLVTHTANCLVGVLRRNTQLQQQQVHSHTVKENKQEWYLSGQGCIAANKVISRSSQTVCEYTKPQTNDGLKLVKVQG